MQRRNLLLASVAAAGWSARPAAAAEAGVSSTEVLFGQTAILSGNLGVPMKDRIAGAQIAFDQVKQQGGIFGRNIRLISLDDQQEPAKALANYDRLLKQDQVFGFFGCGGTATTAAAADILKQSGAPLIAGFAVADSARDKVKGLAYFLRTTVRREAEVLVQQLITIGSQRIALVSLDNAGGAEVMDALRAALSARQLKPHAEATVKPDGSNVAATAAALVRSSPQAVIMYLGGPLPGHLIKAVVEGGGHPMFYGMSVVAGELAAKVAGSKVSGLVIAQVVPYPWSQIDTVAKTYRGLAAKAKLPVDYYGYEGYLSGLLLIEALKRCGKDLTRAKLHDTMRSLKFRMAAMDIDFTGGNHTGSNAVDLVQVRADGSFTR